jgi:ATP-dependent DNA ligase
MALICAGNRCGTAARSFADLIRPDPRAAIQFNDHYEGDGAVLFKQACALGLEGIVSKRALSPYKSGPSKFWLKTKNVVESELILLGTDYDNEDKPIAYLCRTEGRRGELRFAGTAFLTLSGQAREKLQQRIGRLSSIKPPAYVPKVRRPEQVKPDIGFAICRAETRFDMQRFKGWLSSASRLA